MRRNQRVVAVVQLAIVVLIVRLSITHAEFEAHAVGVLLAQLGTSLTGLTRKPAFFDVVSDDALHRVVLVDTLRELYPCGVLSV